MLTNIPGQTLDHLKNDLEIVTDLEPNHISIYPFIVEKNTPFFSKLEKGEITMPTEETAFNLFNLSNQFLCEKEFIQYEISHFATLRRAQMGAIGSFSSNYGGIHQIPPIIEEFTQKGGISPKT